MCICLSVLVSRIILQYENCYKKFVLLIQISNYNIAGVVLAFLVLVAVSPLATGRALHESEKRPIQTERPYNIAHRGDNGELPEESAPAYHVCPLIPLCDSYHQFH